MRGAVKNKHARRAVASAGQKTLGKGGKLKMHTSNVSAESAKAGKSGATPGALMTSLRIWRAWKVHGRRERARKRGVGGVRYASEVSASEKGARDSIGNSKPRVISSIGIERSTNGGSPEGRLGGSSRVPCGEVVRRRG